MSGVALPSARQRGAALLLVLWLLVLMISLVGVFALGARTEALQGRTSLDFLPAGAR